MLILQHTRIVNLKDVNLKDGDANTAFFHRQCSFLQQKNGFFSLTTNGMLLTKHNEMA